LPPLEEPEEIGAEATAHEVRMHVPVSHDQLGPAGYVIAGSDHAAGCLLDDEALLGKVSAAPVGQHVRGGGLSRTQVLFLVGGYDPGHRRSVRQGGGPGGEA